MKNVSAAFDKSPLLCYNLMRPSEKIPGNLQSIWVVSWEQYRVTSWSCNVVQRTPAENMSRFVIVSSDIVVL